MKHYLTADLHYKLTKYLNYSFLDDVVSSTDFILDQAKLDKEPKENKILWVVGDVSDINRPAPVVNEVMIDFFRRATEIFGRVIVLLGNHDNNDSNKDALIPIEKAVPEIDVIRDLETVEINNVKWLCFPHLSRKLLYKVVPPSTDYNKAVEAYMKHKKIDVGDVEIIVGHMLVEGAKYGAENVLLREQAYKTKLFKNVLCFLGHIHKPQILRDNAHYIGSPTINDFSERNEKKRFIIYDDDVDKMQDVFIPNPRWVQLDLDFTSATQLTAAHISKIKKGDRVKLNISTKEKTHYRIDVPGIIEKIEEKGGMVLQYKLNRVDRDKKIDVKNVDTAEDFMKNITKMVRKFLQDNYGKESDKPTIDRVVKICLDNISTDKYSHVKEGIRIKLDYIRMKNMFRYKDVTIKFSNGLTGILGKNGTGKSSIVDGMLYAITGEERGGYAGCSKNTYVSDKEPMEAELGLKAGKKSLKILRGRKKSGPYAELYLNGNEEPDTCGETAVTKRIEELIGVDYDTLVNTSIFREEFQDRFLKGKVQDRERYIKNHFGLDFVKDSYDAVHEILKQHKKDYTEAETELKHYTEELKGYDLPTLEVEYVNWTKELGELTKKLRIKNEELKEVNKIHAKVEDLNEVESNYKDFEIRIKKTETLISDYEKIKDVSVNLDEQKKQLEKEKSKYNKFADKADQCEEEIKKIEEYVEILKAGGSGSKDCKCSVCRSDLNKDTMNNTVKHFDSEIKRYRSEIEKCDVSQEELDPIIDGMESKVSDLESDQENYTKAQAYIKSKSVELKKAREDLKKLADRLVKLKELKSSVSDTDPDAIEREINKLNSRKDTVVREQTEVKRDIDECKDVKNSVRKHKSKMNEAGKEMKIYGYAESVFSNNGIVVTIMDHINELISKWSNHILDLLSSESIYVDLKRNNKGVNVMIDWDGSLKEYVMYSGGEKTLLNFAVRFGFSMALSSITGFVTSLLVLDEVFGKLDDDNRMHMISIVNYVGDKGFSQVLVITHTGLKDHINQVINIERNGNESIAVQ